MKGTESWKAMLSWVLLSPTGMFGDSGQTTSPVNTLYRASSQSSRTKSYSESKNVRFKGVTHGPKFVPSTRTFEIPRALPSSGKW